MYRSNAWRCADVWGMSFNQITTPHVPEVCVVESVPVAGGRKRVAALAGAGAKGAHGLLREKEVIELASGGEERQDPGTRCGRVAAPRVRGEVRSQTARQPMNKIRFMSVRLHSTLRGQSPRFAV